MSHEDILRQRGYDLGEFSSTLWRKWIVISENIVSHVMVSMSGGRPMVFASDHGGYTDAQKEKLELIRLCGFEDGDKKVEGVKRA